MQKETKTANGRRRIQPVFLTEAADNFNAKNADLFSGSRNTPVRRGILLAECDQEEEDDGIDNNNNNDIIFEETERDVSH